MLNHLHSSALCYITHIDTYSIIESAAKYQIEAWPQEIIFACKHVHESYIQFVMDNDIYKITPACIVHLLENNAYDIICRYAAQLEQHNRNVKEYIHGSDIQFNYSDIGDIISEFYAKRNMMVAPQLMKFYNQVTYKILVGFYIKYQNLSHIQTICDIFGQISHEQTMQLCLFFSQTDTIGKYELDSVYITNAYHLCVCKKIIKYSSIERLKYIIDNNICRITPKLIGSVIQLKDKAIKFMFDIYPDDIQYDNLINGLFYDMTYADYIRWDKVKHSKILTMYIIACKINNIPLLKILLPHISNEFYLSGLDCYVRPNIRSDYIQISPDVTKLVLDYLIENNISCNTYIRFAYKKITYKNAIELTEYDKCMVDYYNKVIEPYTL